MTEKYFKPKTLKEACEILETIKDKKPLILAGGTDAMVMHRKQYLSTTSEYIQPYIIDINALKKEIGCIIEKGKSKAEIGALVTYTDLLESKIIAENIPIIAQASYTVGGRQIQNMGTIGGMLGTATPAADVALALLVMDADVVLYSKNGYRKVSINEFYTDYRKTARRDNEIIVGVITDYQTQKEKYRFRKVGGRRGQVIAVTGFCGRLVLSKDDVIVKSRLTLASQAPYSIRLMELEKMLEGKSFTDIKSMEESITNKLYNSLNPIDEVIASAEYKKYTAVNLVLDFLLERD